MAEQTLQQIRFLYRQGGQGSPVMRGGEEEKALFKEGASQSWKAGELLQIADADGKVVVAVGSEGTPSKIAGQAMEPATGTADSPVYLRAITPEDVFVANVWHATKASAVTAQSQLGDVFPLRRVSNKWHVDIQNVAEDASTARARVRVIGFWPDDAIGDVYGRVMVQFLEYTLATDGSPNERILQLA